MSESTAPENARAYGGGRATCYACEAREAVAGNARERDEDLGGALFYAYRR